jgi:hypothetical protein
VTENAGVGERVEDDEFWHEDHTFEDWIAERVRGGGG